MISQKNSFERLENIQNQLSKLSNNLEEEYWLIRKECMEELEKDQKDKIIQKNEMYLLYQKLENNMPMRLRWVNNKLPWYITKFLKITSTEISLVNDSIYIGVNFGKCVFANCYVKITPSDIGWHEKEL